jgi:glycosyltransferase involved in cell wall biosynthesis
LIVAWLVAPEGHASTLADAVTGIGESVDVINLIWKKGSMREPWMDRVKNLRLMPGGDLDASRLGRGDYCLIMREGVVYPAGYVRRMIAAYDDIAVERKIVGVEGVIYSDFFDGLAASRLVYKSDEAVGQSCLVNQLGLEGMIFRSGDFENIPAIDLLAPRAALNFAIQCYRSGIPQICIARGRNWLKPHKIGFSRSNASTDEGSARDAQEIAGFGRLPIRVLNGDGLIPTRTASVKGRLIANEDFRDVLPSVNSLARMGLVAPHWFVDFLGSSHEFAFSVAQSENGRGLRIAIDRAARALRLLSPVDPAAIAARSFQAEVTLRGSGREEMNSLIDGVYLVSMNASHKPEVISRIFGAIADGNSFRTYSTEIKTPRIDAQLDVFFCIQLSRECEFLELASAILCEVSTENRPKIAPAHQAPEPKRGGIPRSGAIGTQRSPVAGSTMELLNPKSAIAKRSRGKPRMAVVCWSLGHNALGRAHSIAELASQDYDVELLGTLVPRHGVDLWPPMRDIAIPIRGFVARDMATYLSAIRDLPATEPYDVVCVSKPRLPSLLLGMVLSARSKCPLVLDIDDLELAFLQNQTPLALDRLTDALQGGTPEIDNPAAEIWTRFCDTLAHHADAITVSNEALGSRFDAIVLRHARDESKFLPDEIVRRETRRSLGIREQEKVVFFLGTPRDHKGLARVAEAIVRRADPDLTMCVMGFDASDDSMATIARQNPELIRLFGLQPYGRLPDLIQCADAICLLQDTSSAISAFQSPAKMGEALAMGLPVLASRVAPFADLISSGIVIPVDTDSELQSALDGVLDGRFNLAVDRNKRTAYFRSELSFAANGGRLREAVSAATNNYPKSSALRLGVLRKLAVVLRDRFGVDILEFTDGTVRPQPEKVV